MTHPDRILDEGQSIEWDVVTQYRVFTKHKQPRGGPFTEEAQVHTFLDRLHDGWVDDLWAQRLTAERLGERVPPDVLDGLDERPYFVMARRIGPWQYLRVVPQGAVRLPSDATGEAVGVPIAFGEALGTHDELLTTQQLLDEKTGKR